MTDTTFIFRVVTVTLAVVIITVNVVLLIGLFDPVVDNQEIFAVLGPSYQTVIGAFVGFLSALALKDQGK